ncbi:MAG: tyrosine-type recombinase/integrase [Thermoflexibacter sp.]|jgi:integrase/recombinase XerC|nr:tyrosine-type recombinase/integrase [Thermoflexibacter sp.]
MLEAFSEYLEYQKRYSKHTLTAYMTDLAQFEEFYEKLCQEEGQKIEDISLDKATLQDVRCWVISLVEQQEDGSKLNHKSINRKLSALKAFYHFLEQRKLIERNPVNKIKRLKISKNLPLFVIEDGMEKLLEEVPFEDGFGGVRDKLIIELLYGTGIRLSELINLKISDIDLYKSSIKVLGKRNKERIIPIHEVLLDFLKKYLQLKGIVEGMTSDDYLLTTIQGEQAYPMMIWRIVKKMLDQVSTIERRSPHVLRHTFATHLLDNGADLNAIKDLLGHSTLVSTQVYTHNSVEKLKRVFEKAHPKA